MLAKNTRALVATVAVALITGIMMALWVALMPAPAQAQSGDVLRLLSIEVVNHTDDEDFGPFGDRADEPYIEVNGVNVWDAGNTNDHLSDGTTRTIDASVPISGDNVSVQVWEADGGRQSVTNPDDLIGDFPPDIPTEQRKLRNSVTETAMPSTRSGTWSTDPRIPLPRSST